MQIFLKELSILGLILIISACGFQLRGDIQANFDSISISGGTSSFNKTLQRKFRQAGITITNASEAEKNVEIIENKLNCIFKDLILIIENFNYSSVSISGSKKLNGSQFVKENISYILNSLKFIVTET